MGNILSNKEWVQQQNEEDQELPSSSISVAQDENVNPGTPVVESTSKMIKRKLSSVVNSGTEYTRVNSSEATPISNKVVLGSNFDPRSPTTGIVR